MHSSFVFSEQEAFEQIQKLKSLMLAMVVMLSEL
jgi:hypothetical protein